MKNAINGTWLLGIVLTFMAIFIAYITISIDYSSAYMLKTKMVTIIEQYEGMNGNTVQKLYAAMLDEGYMGLLGCKSKDGEKVLGGYENQITVNPTKKMNYCVTRDVRYGEDATEDKYYYTITVTFAYSVPILGDIFDFKVSGETKDIRYPHDSYF